MHATSGHEIYCCTSVFASQNSTVQVLYCKPSTETWDVPWTLQPGSIWTSCTVREVQDDSKPGENIFKLHWLQIFIHLLAGLWGRKTSEQLTAETTSVASSVCSLQLQPPLEDSLHPPAFLKNCILLRSVWRSMQSFTSGCTDVSCSLPLHPTLNRGSALCQLESGAYYWSCWNDGF